MGRRAATIYIADMSNPERWKRFADLPTDLVDRLERLPDWLRERGVELAWLFGSLGDSDAAGDTGRDEQGKPGDIDLAVLLPPGRPVATLRAALEAELGTDRIDLVDLRRASPILRFHVIRDGRLLLARDDDTLNDFELATLHLYRDTAPLRRRHRGVLRERMDAWS